MKSKIAFEFTNGEIFFKVFVEIIEDFKIGNKYNSFIFKTAK